MTDCTYTLWTCLDGGQQYVGFEQFDNNVYVCTVCISLLQA